MSNAEKENLRENIISVTIDLINENDGDVNKITARAIAARAGVGLGLINYHFGSKKELVVECVQRIINTTVTGFNPANEGYEGTPLEQDKKRLGDGALRVFEFLYANEAISRVSILGDLEEYVNNCNSVNTQKGLLNAISSPMDEQKKKLIVFSLVSAMQVAFLSKGEAKKILGFDLSKKEERENYIRSLVEVLL